MLCAAVTPSVTAVTRERGCASPSPSRCYSCGRIPGIQRQPQPRICVCVSLSLSLCIKWNFTRFTRSKSRRSTSNPARLPGASRRQGWVGEMGPHPPGSGSRNSGPRRAGRGPGDKGRAGRAGMEGWMEGGEGKRCVDRECWQGSAPPAPCGGDKGDKGDKGAGAGRARRLLPSARTKFSGTERAARTATFPLRRVWFYFFLIFPPEVSKCFTLTTKGSDFIHQLESEVSGKGWEGGF